MCCTSNDIHLSTPHDRGLFFAIIVNQRWQETNPLSDFSKQTRRREKCVWNLPRYGWLPWEKLLKFKFKETRNERILLIYPTYCRANESPHRTIFFAPWISFHSFLSPYVSNRALKYSFILPYTHIRVFPFTSKTSETLSQRRTRFSQYYTGSQRASAMRLPWINRNTHIKFTSFKFHFSFSNLQGRIFC